MLIAFLCTMLFLPAAITLFRPPREAGFVGFAWAEPLDQVDATPTASRCSACSPCLRCSALVLLPRLTFDSDPLHTKNPNTEAMRTLYDLMDSPVTNPFTIDILAPNAEAAGALARAARRKLPLVGDVLTVNSFVPKDQQPKLALIADAANILGPTLGAARAGRPGHPGSDPAWPPRSALDADRARAAEAAAGSPARRDRRRSAPAQHGLGRTVVIAPNEALTRFLPMQLDQLRTALDAQPVTLESLPPDMTRDWLLPNGQARVQVVPKPEARNSEGLRKFVDAGDRRRARMRAAPPSRSRRPARRSSARSAPPPIAALVAITIILFIALRRVLDVALVLAPLLAVGADDGDRRGAAAAAAELREHHRAAAAARRRRVVQHLFRDELAGRTTDVLGSPTARAILFSALTTARPSARSRCRRIPARRAWASCC